MCERCRWGTRGGFGGRRGWRRGGGRWWRREVWSWRAPFVLRPFRLTTKAPRDEGNWPRISRINTDNFWGLNLWGRNCCWESVGFCEICGYFLWVADGEVFLDGGLHAEFEGVGDEGVADGDFGDVGDVFEEEGEVVEVEVVAGVDGEFGFGGAVGGVGV